MQKFLASSLILAIVCLSFLLIPQANALPISYNQTALNFGLTSVPRNSSSYDVFTLNQDNWLWMKFNNNTVDSSPFSVNSTITYNTNLQKYFSFNSVLTDTINHGSMVVVGTTSYSSGQENNAFLFNGNTNMSSAGTGLVNGTGSRSVSFWLKTPASAPASYSYLFGQGGGGLNSPFTLYLSSTYTLVSNSFGNDRTSATTLSASTWYYITEVLSNTGQTRDLYINGVEDGNFPYVAAAINTPASKLYIGNAVWDGNHNLPNGAIIDEFRYYNTNLSLAQHKALYMVGHYSQSHTFDGGEYITTTQIANFERTSPFSLSYWFKTTASTTFSIIGTSGANLGWTNYFDGTNINFYLLNNLGAGNYAQIRTNSLVNDGNWHYIAFTYDGSSSTSGMNAYVDNTLSKVNVFNALTNTIQGNANLLIGKDPSNSAVIGQLDNVKIYPYALSSSQITSDYNSISPISSGKQYMSWYNGISGSSTLTKKLGAGQATITTSCALNNINPVLISNYTTIYYVCTATNAVKYVPITTGTSAQYFAMQTPSGVNNKYLFSTMQKIMTISSSGSGFASIQSTKTANNSLAQNPTSWQVSNQKISTSTSGLKYNMNTTSIQTVSTNACEINYSPTNTTKLLDSIACDQSIPAMTVRYWNGFMIQKVANYNTNSTQTFLNSIDASAYKKLLSLPCLILVNETPCITFIATDFSNTDYLVVLTSTHVYYGNAQTALTLLQNHNYALQSYDIITTGTTSAYEIQNPILQGITLYGFNLNTTLNKAGLFTLPSGYTTKTTTINSAIRTIDPQWTNDATDIPIITTSSSLFPIFLTASNSPAFAAIKVTSGTQIINGQEAVYAVAQLDSTRSVEFDLIAGTCANVYIADISVSPSIWNFQGIICATGVNQKTIAYTNTVPFTFYTLKYGVTDSYVPANNGLQTTFRTQAAPTTYTVIVKNSTGTTAINQTFTIPANQTIDTRTFNVSSVSKPASLTVSVGGNMIYSAYLGSSLSLASVSSFFHQYFSYQGFDLLSFIPVIFASAFTRNTVGAGMVLVVLMIATLSWLSVTVVPEPVVYVSIFISILGLIGYRSVYG